MHAIELALELLGYNQHRDFHVHGVPHVAAIDFANTSTGQATTATDDKRVQPVAGAGNLTPSDLAGHVKGDYGSEGWGFESLRARSVETDDQAPEQRKRCRGPLSCRMPRR